MKKIVIKDKGNLYKKLCLYKSILYRNTIFETEIEDDEIGDLVKALNIKNRKKRIEFIYDSCCKKIDDYCDGKNFCDFKENQCTKQQQLKCKRTNGCCRLCSHQSSNGCTTSNLACKLHYCDLVTSKHKVLKIKDLTLLKLFSQRQKLIAKSAFYAKREQHIMDLYFGSIVIFSFRVTVREIIGLIKLKKVIS